MEAHKLLGQYTLELRGKRGPCKVEVQGRPCGAKHNSQLHGSTSKFSNFVQINSVAANGQVVPNEEDLLTVENRTALMQVQWVEVATGENGNVQQAITFWDSGSNVTIVRRRFAV